MHDAADEPLQGAHRRARAAAPAQEAPGHAGQLSARGVLAGVLVAVLLGLSLALSPNVRGEAADRDKPLNVESDRMTADEARKTVVFEGRVVLTQGTLAIRANRLIIRQDAKGNPSGVATGAPAQFRQKRDAGPGYIEGEALRIEFEDDGKGNRVQFFDSARLRRENGDDVCGNYITYDSRTENFTVQSARDAQATGCDSRVRAVIMPRARPAESK